MTVSEQAGTATMCVLLGDLQAGESLGSPVTVTMIIIDGINASKF